MIPPVSEGLEKDLETLPDEVSIALVNWRTATIDREMKEALLYLKYKNSEDKRTEGEVKALINSNNERYDIKLKEALAEAEYNKLYERLMSSKRLAALRTAY